MRRKDREVTDQKEIFDIVKDFSGDIFLWGNGKRGMAFQQFCKKHDINLSGVCDAVDESIGDDTSLGFTIVSTDEVKQSKGIVVASNHIVFDALKKMDISAHILNLQQYIKYE